MKKETTAEVLREMYENKKHEDRRACNILLKVMQQEDEQRPKEMFCVAGLVVCGISAVGVLFYAFGCGH